MTRSLTAELASFTSDDWSVRAVTGLLGVLPFAATWRPPATLLDAAAAVDPALATRIAARAEVLGAADGPQAALAAFDFLDKGDTGIAIFSGLRSAVTAARGQGAALEMDPQQATDAGLKAVGIAWAAWKLYEGSPTERAQALIGTPTGRALMTWFIASDLVLPFADNLAQGGAAGITSLIASGAAENANRLAAVAGPEAVQATGVLNGMVDSLQSGLGQAAAYAEPLAAWVDVHVPKMLSRADQVTGVVATMVDTLPCYRLVGAALVAEVCVQKAAAEVRAEVAREAEAAEAARRAEETARLREIEARVAEAKSRIEEEKARRAATRQQEDYSLEEAADAASLRNNPIRVTRGAEVTPAASAEPARSGCLGCGTVLLLGLLLGAAAGAIGVYTA